MKFSYNWLKELVGFRGSPQDLAEFLTLRAFEVGSVEKVGSDYALDITLLPNRVADASGHIGMAREIASLKNLEFRIHNLESRISESKQSADEKLKVKIEDKEDCPRYIARVVNKMKIGQSPEWLKRRLEVCGIEPINNIVDAANFVMLETGQPLHVFDYEKLQIKGSRKREIPNSKFQIPKTIVVRRAKKEEKLLALDDKTYQLNSEVLVIADGSGPIAVAGIKGGKESGVSAHTKTIVLEAANFSPARIRKGSHELGLKTDASYRFEHGPDPNLADTAIDRLSALINKIAGGEIMGGKIDVYLQEAPSAHLPLRVDYANRLIGVNFAQLMYEVALKRLGFAYEKRRTGVYHVEVPTIRRDLEIEEDLVEEVVRIWGYEKVPSTKPMALLAVGQVNDELFWEEKIKNLLVGGGFTEVFRYIFTGEQELKAFGLDARSLIEVTNPITPEHRFLASTALPSYIRAAKENEAHQVSIRIFGLTKGFASGKGVWFDEVSEKKRLVIIWSEKSGTKNELFFGLKGVVDELFEALGLAEYWYDDEIEHRTRSRELPFFHPYRTAEIRVDNQKVGVIGEIHPQTRNTLKIKHSLAAAEIDADLLISAALKEAEYHPVSPFPAVRRDIALIVPEEEKTERITDVIENIGGKLLIDSDLFDYFQDEAMRKGRKKSLAFHLIFQSKERTLTDKEVDAVMKKVVRALEEKGWVVRK